MENKAKFAVSTDSTSDWYPEDIEKHHLYVGRLEYTFTRGDKVDVYLDDFKKRSEYADFYQALRSGVVARTSILSVQAHVDLFTKMAKDGVKTALHITQGYGLSPTVDNANAAIAIVKKDYPDINYVAFESGTTTRAAGLLTRVAVEMRDAGKTLEETVKKLESLKAHTQHFILVNDLKFLARSGRVSNLAAGFGSVLQVKPIIEFGKDGKLKVCRKEIGLKRAMRSIVNDFGTFTLDKDFPYVEIVHTDNEALAKELQAMFQEKYHIEPPITYVGPIVGTHVGPDAVGYVCLTNEDRPYD